MRLPFFLNLECGELVRRDDYSVQVFVICSGDSTLFFIIKNNNMKWKVRVSAENIFFVEIETVEEMLEWISKYEKEHSTSIRVCCAMTGKRIIGGVLQYSK